MTSFCISMSIIKTIGTVCQELYMKMMFLWLANLKYCAIITYYFIERGEDMERGGRLFLEAMKTALQDRTVDWDQQVSAEELKQVLTLAQMHHVLPMIFEAVYCCPAARKLEPELVEECRMATLQSVMAQAVKTEEFLELYSKLRSRGLEPLVVKGLVCRRLYPRPDERDSGDEDVLCGEASFPKCHKAMIEFGMEPGSPDLESYEVPYRKGDGLLYIELHKTLFPGNSDIFGDCNRIFEKSFEHPAKITVHGVEVATLDWSEHMLYLILHAFKHFLHSGFGIRQVCDMVLFANAYGDRVDWRYVRKKCNGLRAERFAAAIFAIGEKYLTFSPEKAHYPGSWRDLGVDPEPLLQDLLLGGIYGSADRSRVHSSNMTLNAVKADKAGKQGGNLLLTVFPPAKRLVGRFRWLRRRPWLLPVAWLLRLLGYLKEALTRSDSSAAAVIRMGSKRVELLRQYDIID